MAKPDFQRKRGDTGPPVRITLLNPDGTPFDPAGYALSFFFQDVDLAPASPAETGAGSFAIVGTGSTGEVDYTLAAADVDTVGSFRFEVEALLGGDRRTFPGGSYGLFDVVQDLGDG